MSFRLSLKFVLLLAFGISSSVAGFAQQTGSTVRGVVADPDSAVIPGATVTLTPASGKASTTESQSDGTYTVRNLAPGTYSITVTMNGFATFVRQGVKIASAQTLTLDAKMAIQDQEQVIQVTTQNNTLSVDQDSNASSTVIKGKDLEALSDDPDELSSELTALAGPAAGPNGGQIYVDGFTGGQLPPKSSIREIRINQNPFSAQYDKLGYGRVEVFTKPGTDKFHGSGQLNANDSSFNTGSPLLNSGLSSSLAPVVQPPYHTIFFFGNLTGPISKNASFSAGGSHRSIQDNAIVNGTVVGSATNPICGPGDTTCVLTPYQAAVPVPQSRSDFTPRLDLAFGQKNTLTARYQYEQNDQTNNGVGSFVTATAGSSTASSENTIQISDTQIVSNRIINETRFEYQREAAAVNATSTAAAVSVQGAFTAGGSSAGSSSDIQNHFEGQNYTSIQLKKNFIRLGGRLRTTTDNNISVANPNGVFTYVNPAAYIANNPSQFTITKVNSGSKATTVDVGVYAEDDWKVKPNLTVSYGIRYEAQNFISERHDITPRLSFAYGLGSAKGTPKTVLRGGFGIFYDRFTLADQLITQQENGISQSRSIAIFNTPPAQVCSPTTVSACLASAALRGNQTYVSASNLRSPYTMQFAIGADQQLFRGATLSLNYLHAVGNHQFISLVTSTAPVQYQFSSEGTFKQNQLIANFNLRSSRYYSLFGYYALNFANSDTAGASSFPTNSNNIRADYGRATFSTRNRLFLGGSITAPFHIAISPFVIAASGTPYNITTGTDVNGDSQYTDRPTFANGSSGRCTVKGDFVTPPNGTTNYTPIPINYCTGPALFTANVRVSKTFGFGPLTDAAAARAARASGGGPGGGGAPRGGGGPGGGGPGGGGPGGGGPGGGGGGRGGPGGGGPGGGGASTGKRYNLAIGAQAQNLFNYKDLSTPVGTLTSQQFGQSLQLAGNPYTSNSAVERLQVFMSFNF
ncbi:TonB-dependent receptor [Granulicella arctica]|uniref:TonB-dependent receptor n=1 Tax=Granulicella arctica TaxID=940613 RepID=UPI0021DF9429|nr:TonB-dependent receptor [Granulicella arctica]